MNSFEVSNDLILIENDDGTQRNFGVIPLRDVVGIHALASSLLETNPHIKIVRSTGDVAFIPGKVDEIHEWYTLLKDSLTNFRKRESERLLPCNTNS